MKQCISATITQSSAAGGIDLHAHTTASDGSLSPSELVKLAKEIGLSALSVTDHDTLDGLPQAQVVCGEAGIDFITGVELSVEDDKGRFHLLGYGFQVDARPLTEALISLRRSRDERNKEMGEKMRLLGLPVTMDDVLAEAGPDSQVIARPHFARALVKVGVVSTIQEAFDMYLATGKPLYQPKDVLTPRDAIKLLHDAGGAAVMAHPGLVPLGEEALAVRFRDLAKEDGLDGIEAYYSQHSEEDTVRFLKLAADSNLIVTAGSDFHGIPKPHVNLGVIYGGAAAPRTILECLRQKAASYRTVREGLN